MEYLTLAQQLGRNILNRATAPVQNPLWTNRVGVVDWQELTDEVANDITIASRSRSGGGVECAAAPRDRRGPAPRSAPMIFRPPRVPR